MIDEIEECYAQARLLGFIPKGCFGKFIFAEAECEELWSRFRELASNSRPRFFPTYCLSFSRFDFCNPFFDLGGPRSFDICVIAFVQAGK